ncbi:hypothetical protein [Nocardia sp. MW-W600-9]
MDLPGYPEWERAGIVPRELFTGIAELGGTSEIMKEIIGRSLRLG